jgi:hypothetical protein
MSVSNLDKWIAAKQLQDRYGERAAMEAAERSNAALEAGDTFNYELWQRVMMAIQELERTKPLDGESVN